MLRPTRRPAALPAGARRCRIGTWGGGLGTFWQQGVRIGVVWDVMPEWGDNITPPFQSYYHVLGDEDVARQYFDLMSESMHEMRPDLGKKEEG